MKLNYLQAVAAPLFLLSSWVLEMREFWGFLLFWISFLCVWMSYGYNTRCVIELIIYVLIIMILYQLSFMMFLVKCKLNYSVLAFVRVGRITIIFCCCCCFSCLSNYALFMSYKISLIVVAVSNFCVVDKDGPWRISMAWIMNKEGLKSWYFVFTSWNWLKKRVLM